MFLSRSPPHFGLLVLCVSGCARVEVRDPSQLDLSFHRVVSRSGIQVLRPDGSAFTFWATAPAPWITSVPGYYSAARLPLAFYKPSWICMWDKQLVCKGRRVSFFLSNEGVFMPYHTDCIPRNSVTKQRTENLPEKHSGLQQCSVYGPSHLL